MRVEPEHEEISAGLRSVARDAADRTHREGVITAEHDRQPPVAEGSVGFARERGIQLLVNLFP